MMMRAVLLVWIIWSLLGAGAARAVTVTTGAPMFVANADSAAAILDRCTNPANPSYPYLNPLWTSWRNFVIGQPVVDNGSGSSNDNTDASQMLWWSILYRLEGNPQWLTNAKAERGFLPSTYERWVFQTSRWNFIGAGLNAQSTIGIAYSFVHDGLTAGERTSWVTPLICEDQALDAKSGEVTDPWRWHCVSMIPAAVVIGSGNAGAHDQGKWDNLMTHWQTWCADCMNRLKYLDNYSGQKGLSLMVNAEVQRNCSPSVGDPLADYLDFSWRFWSHRIRGELNGVASSSDSTIALERQIGKWDTNDIDFLQLMSYFGGRRNQPVACAWNRLLLQRHIWTTVTSRDRANAVWPSIIWGIPGIHPTATINDTPLIAHFPFVDVTTMRQGWALGSENRYIALGFYPFSMGFNAETPWGSILWRRGRDNGFWRAGFRQVDQDEHYQPYQNRTVATNSIRIYDSAETSIYSESEYNSTWSGQKRVWSGADSVALGCSGSSLSIIQRIPPNDGGSDVYALNGSNTDWYLKGRARLPECNPGASDYTVNGTTFAFDTLGGVYYRQVARGDSAYALTKQSGVWRSVSWLFDGSALVVDEIRNDKANTPVIQDWHTTNIVRCNALSDGLITRVAGAASIPVDGNDTQTNPPGGVYTVPVDDGEYLHTVNGASLFVAKPLLATALASGSTAILQMAGGPNSVGSHAKQSWKANDTFSYDAADPSFEWYIDTVGRNMVMGNYTCVPGTLMADGVHYHFQPEGVRTLVSNPVPIRPANGTVSKGVDPCTWTGSIKVTPSAANDTVLIATVLYAGSAVVNDNGRAGLPLWSLAKRGGTLSFLNDAQEGVGVRLEMSVQRMPRFAGVPQTAISWTRPAGTASRPSGGSSYQAGLVGGMRPAVFASYGGHSAARRWRRVAQNTTAGPGACCTRNGICFIRDADLCDSGGQIFMGSGTTCDPDPCPPGIPGRCCVEGECQDDLNKLDCEAAGGEFFGPGTECIDSYCLSVGTGACCAEDGSCTLEAYADCHGAGGIFFGSGTDCSPSPCSPPPATGACCVGLVCSILTEAACITATGTYLGDDTACDVGICAAPPALGACCNYEGGHLCVETTEAICGAGGGSYGGDATECEFLTCRGSIIITSGCCLEDGTCVVATDADCLDLGGTIGDTFSDCEPDPCGEVTPIGGDPVEHFVFDVEPGGVYLISVDTDDNGSFETYQGSTTANSDGVLRFVMGAAYDAAKAVKL